MYYSFYLDANFSFIRRRRGSLRGLPLGHPYPMRGAITPMATEVIAGYVTEDKREICAKEKLKDINCTYELSCKLILNTYVSE